MKDEKKMERLQCALGIFNMATCFVAAVICIFQKNAPAAFGFLCACLAFIDLNLMTRRCNDWKNLCMKSIDLLRSLFGESGEIVGIEVLRLSNDKDVKGQKEDESKKELPDFAPKAAESFHECAKEFFHYVEEGNREFSISHGGVTLSVSIPEDEPVPAKREVTGVLENGAAEQK